MTILKYNLFLVAKLFTIISGNIMKRVISSIIQKDLEKKMVLLSGPRQVGKTWLAFHIGETYQNPLYLNYDNRKHREIIDNEDWLDKTDLLIFDEIHKMPKWKNYLKGVYDTKLTQTHILVTGSARLETFRQSGDSLAGRYYRHRLFPFTPSDIPQNMLKPTLDKFMQNGGFPEPFLATNPIDAKRWRKQYLDGLIREDILHFDNIHNLRDMNLLLELLRERVASPLSYTSLAQDLRISSVTVKKYIDILEALYIIFPVTPFSRNIARSLIKTPKIYFFDTGLVKGDSGIIFENLVAVSLLKYVYELQDNRGEDWELKYIRTKDGREVDFCLVKDNQWSRIIEVKHKNDNVVDHLKYFSNKYDISAMQVVLHLKNERKKDMIEIRRGMDFLQELTVFKS